MPVTVTRWHGIEQADPAFLLELKREADARGWDYDSLLGHISMESRFQTDAGSPTTTAGGLIQMVDSTAKGIYGVNAQAVRRMSYAEQLPGIVKYFSGLTNLETGDPLAGPDFRLMGFSRNPYLIGAPDSRVVYAAGSLAARVNPTYQDADGAITAGTIRRSFRKYADAHAGKTWQIVPDSRVPAPEGVASAGMGAGLPVMVLAGLGLLALKLKGR